MPANRLASIQLAGFPSVANGGNPANGTGLLGSYAVDIWDDYTITFTSTSGGAKVTINPTQELTILLEKIVRGTNGVSTTKRHNPSITA